MRAWYFGTAITVGLAIVSGDTQNGLRTIATLLGGFASARVLGYVVDGVDVEPNFRAHQHGESQCPLLLAPCRGRATATATAPIPPTPARALHSRLCARVPGDSSRRASAAFGGRQSWRRPEGYLTNVLVIKIIM